MRVLLAAALLLLPLGAGCLGSHPAKDPAQLVATPTTGILRGVVVDEAIRPLGNVTIRVAASGGDRNATTAPDGLFAFAGLPPGGYLVRAHKLGFFDESLAVNVTAGVDAPPEVHVQLRADVLNTPAIEAFTFNGFLQCSVTAVLARAAACNPSESLSPVCQLPVDVCTAGPGNLTEDRFMAVHSVSRQSIRFLQNELVWTPTSQLSASLRATPGSRNPTDGKISDFRPFEGASPLVMPMPGDIAQGLLIGNGRDLVVRVFSGYVNGTNPPTCLPSPFGCPWGVGASYEQKFQLFTHVFYGFAPPEGWQFSRDGTPPIPQ